MSESTSDTATLHWPTLIQVVLSGIGVLLSWGGSAFVFVGGVIEWFSPSDDPYAVSTAFSLFIAGMVVGGLLVAPMFFGIMRLNGRVVELGGWWPRLRRWFHPKWMLAGYPLLLGLGYLAGQAELSRDLLLPLLNIFVLGIPVLVMVWLALRGLPKGSPQLGWGAFSLGLAIGPTAVLFLELAVFIVMTIWLLISAVNDQALMEVLSGVASLVYEANNPAMIEQVLGDMFNTPQVVVAIMVFLAGFVPVIEEIFKPISVWVLLGRKLRPVDGWVIGALSGAGFALFENFGQASVSSDWIIGIISRAAATIPHVFTAALMGYTLALARTQKKYGKALVAFVGVVAIHAAWNAAYVLNTTAILASPDGLLDPEWAPVFLVAVGVLAAGMVIALLKINRKLRQEPAAALFADALPADLLEQNPEQISKEIQIHGTDYDVD
jgi:RsiW-degrading membrane proteinase PrsW (M82 family)